MGSIYSFLLMCNTNGCCCLVAHWLRLNCVEQVLSERRTKSHRNPSSVEIVVRYLIINVSPKNIQLTCFVKDYSYSLRIPLRSRSSRLRYISSLLKDWYNILHIKSVVSDVMSAVDQYNFPNLSPRYGNAYLSHLSRTFNSTSKLYTPSTLNIDLILWHTHLIVCAWNVKSYTELYMC